MLRSERAGQRLRACFHPMPIASDDHDDAIAVRPTMLPDDHDDHDDHDDGRPGLQRMQMGVGRDAGNLVGRRKQMRHMPVRLSCEGWRRVLRNGVGAMRQHDTNANHDRSADNDCRANDDCRADNDRGTDDHDDMRTRQRHANLDMHGVAAWLLQRRELLQAVLVADFAGLLRHAEPLHRTGCPLHVREHWRGHRGHGLQHATDDHDHDHDDHDDDAVPGLPNTCGSRVRLPIGFVELLLLSLRAWRRLVAERAGKQLRQLPAS